MSWSRKEINDNRLFGFTLRFARWFTSAPSDTRSWLHCKWRMWHDNFPPDGMMEAEPNPFEELIKEMSGRHEWVIKRDLGQQFQVVEAISVGHTQALMEFGVDIIYQAQIAGRQNKIIGEPYFLILHESGEYQPADAKLARNGNKKEIQIQLGTYPKLLNSSIPALIFLGDKSTMEACDEANKEAEKFFADMHDILSLKNFPETRYGD